MNIYNTVLIIILFRYRYRPVTVFGPPLQNVTVFLKGYIPLPSVRDRDTIVTCLTERYIRNLWIFENLNKKITEHVSK